MLNENRITRKGLSELYPRIKMVNWDMIGAMVLPNAGGWICALAIPDQVVAPNSTDWYETIKKPRWNPPNWVFGFVWTILYSCMGYASYIVYRDCGGFTGDAVMPLALYGGHLLVNWTWTTVFFKFHKIGLSFFHILALDAAAAACAVNFFFVNKVTAFLMAPYLCWLSFATYLSYMYWRLNCGKDKKI